MVVIKWERSIQCRPVHNIISSDFHKYHPQPWKHTENPPLIGRLLSYEYQRMWLDEREQWKKKMYPENKTVNVDIVKRYVMTFKSRNQPPKPEIKKPFKMKKFERINNRISTKRPPGDKAMKFLKKMPDAAQESST